MYFTTDLGFCHNPLPRTVEAPMKIRRHTGIKRGLVNAWGLRCRYIHTFHGCQFGNLSHSISFFFFFKLKCVNSFTISQLSAKGIFFPPVPLPFLRMETSKPLWSSPVFDHPYKTKLSSRFLMDFPVFQFVPIATGYRAPLRKAWLWLFNTRPSGTYRHW